MNAQALLAYHTLADRRYVNPKQPFYVVSVLYPLASALPRISLCTLYIKVFNVNRWTRISSKPVMAFLIVDAIVWTVPILMCMPTSKHMNTPEYICFHFNAHGTWKSLSNILSDLVILCLPLRPLWLMHIERTAKLGILFMFAAGSLGIVGACLRFAFCIRLWYFAQLDENETLRMYITCLNA